MKKLEIILIVIGIILILSYPFTYTKISLIVGLSSIIIALILNVRNNNK